MALDALDWTQAGAMWQRLLAVASVRANVHTFAGDGRLASSGDAALAKIMMNDEWTTAKEESREMPFEYENKITAAPSQVTFFFRVDCAQCPLISADTS